MDAKANVSFDIIPSDPLVPLGLEIWLNEQKIFDTDHVTEKISFRHPITEDAGDQALRWILKNKLPAHTTIDADGNIVKDAVITVTDVCFDEIPLATLFYDHTNYVHDHNGNGPTVDTKFFGIMGCNGTACFKFTSPIYLWILENY